MVYSTLRLSFLLSLKYRIDHISRSSHKVQHRLDLCCYFSWFDLFILLGIIGTGVSVIVPMKQWIVSTTTEDFTARVDEEVRCFFGSFKDLRNLHRLVEELKETLYYWHHNDGDSDDISEAKADLKTAQADYKT